MATCSTSRGANRGSDVGVSQGVNNSFSKAALVSYKEGAFKGTTKEASDSGAKEATSGSNMGASTEATCSAPREQMPGEQQAPAHGEAIVLDAWRWRQASSTIASP